jgi:hypothetical protein
MGKAVEICRLRPRGSHSCLPDAAKSVTNWAAYLFGTGILSPTAYFCLWEHFSNLALSTTIRKNQYPFTTMAYCVLKCTTLNKHAQNRVKSSFGYLTTLTQLLILSLLMSHICGVSKKFGELYHKTNKTEDTNKLTLLAFKIITILHITRLATFIKLL